MNKLTLIRLMSKNKSFDLSKKRFLSSLDTCPTNNTIENLRGIFPTLSTPFKRNQDEIISLKDLESNLSKWSTIPFSGYVLHGFYGEYPYLTGDEKLSVVKFVREFIGKDKTIIVGSSSESVKKTVNLLEQIKKNGADYSLLFTPHYYKKQMTYTAFFEYFTKVADRSPLPIILNNNPSVTFIDLPADLIIELSEHPNIVGLKECSHNIAKIACICEKTKDMINPFYVLTGSASFLLDALRVGAIGSICALANVLGPQIIDLYEVYKKEKLDYNENEKENYKKAQILQSKLIEPDLAIDEMYGVPGLKTLLDAYGYYGGPCRLPLLDLTESEINNLKSIFERNGFEWLRDVQNSRLSYPNRP